MQQEAISNLFNVENKDAGAQQRNYANLIIYNSLPIQLFLEKLDEIFI